jgi:hypothetical protein
VHGDNAHIVFRDHDLKYQEVFTQLSVFDILMVPEEYMSSEDLQLDVAWLQAFISNNSVMVQYQKRPNVNRIKSIGYSYHNVGLTYYTLKRPQ